MLFSLFKNKYTLIEQVEITKTKRIQSRFKPCKIKKILNTDSQNSKPNMFRKINIIKLI